MNQPAANNKLPVHVLKTGVGVVIETMFDPATFRLVCRWTSPPPYSRKMVKRIARDYIPWRNGIMEEAARRAGKRVLVVTPGVDGVPLRTVLGVKKESTP